MAYFSRPAALPYFLNTALLTAAAAVCITLVLVSNLLALPKGWLFSVPGLVCFLVSLIIGFFRLYAFQRQARANNMVPGNWLMQALFLFVVSLVLIIVLEGVWYLISDSVAEAYAAALSEAKVQLPIQTGQESAFPDFFSQLPVMVQALLPVMAGTALGCMLAAWVAHKATG